MGMAMDWDEQQVKHMEYLRERNADLAHRLNVAKGHMIHMAKALHEIKVEAKKNGVDFFLIELIACRGLEGKPTREIGVNEYQEGKLVRWGLNDEGPGAMGPFDERL
jgi:hypothetical protein